MLKESESDEKVDADIELRSSLSRPSASVGPVSPDTLPKGWVRLTRRSQLAKSFREGKVTQG